MMSVDLQPFYFFLHPYVVRLLPIAYVVLLLVLLAPLAYAGLKLLYLAFMRYTVPRREDLRQAYRLIKYREQLDRERALRRWGRLHNGVWFSEWVLMPQTARQRISGEQVLEFHRQRGSQLIAFAGASDRPLHRGLAWVRAEPPPTVPE